MSTLTTFSARTGSAVETLSLGRALGESLIGGLLIGLTGPLGAGKTQFVKGIAAGNSPSGSPLVTSPTFTLLQQYPGRLTLFHIDAYRLPNPHALTALGLEELFTDSSCVVVEWAERVRTVLPENGLWIELQPVDESTRRFTIEGLTAPATTTVQRWRASAAAFFTD